MTAVIVSVDWAGILFAPADDLPFLNEIERGKTWLAQELRRRRNSARAATAWHRRVLPQKPTQWGPATLEAVKAIVERAEPAFKEGLNAEWWVRSAEAARWYAGLLGMEVGLLPAANPENRGFIADAVRNRLIRGEPLRQAAADYPSYTPLPKAKRQKIGHGIMGAFDRQT